MIASMLRTCGAALLGAALVSTAAPARATAAVQADAGVSPVDIQRLQDRVFDLGGDLSRLRSRDSALASRLEGDLGDLRDEVVYLKVKLRKESRVPRSEYADLRDRIDALGSRIRGDGSSGISNPPTAPVDRETAAEATGRRTGTGTSASGTGSSTTSATTSPERATAPGYGTSGTASADPTVADRSRSSSGTYDSRRVREIPVGQELDIRLQTPLNSETAQVEDRFEATTLVDLHEGNQLLVPAGSVLRGVVSSVKKAGRLERRGSMTLSFDQITVDGREYPIRATVTQAIDAGMKGEAGKIGAGAGVGAIIGGILGGFRGALAGILIGGGGTIAATEGSDVKLDAGTVLRIRFDSPVRLESSSSRR